MQSILTLMIEAIVVTFFVAMFIDFVTGIFQLIQATTSVTPDNTSISISIPKVNKPVIYQILSDPWTMELENDISSYETMKSKTIPFPLPVPTLKLLPPAKEIKSEPKRRGRPKKNNTTPNPKTTSTRKRKSPQKAAA
ncbi:DNA-binding protein [Anabaena sp. WFMT]|uniref:DNA-binding protein n=1 Tax=Anabaena sp. WFMT TaxID=3449730 RepID=UPI003F2483F8